MTPINLFTVDFAEIPALEVTCAACKGRITMPLPLPKRDLQQFMDCPSCSARLWEGSGEPVYQSVAGFARALSALKEHPHKSLSLGFTLTGKSVSGN
jgi:hypothetical protein